MTQIKQETKSQNFKITSVFSATKEKSQAFIRGCLSAAINCTLLIVT